MDLVTLNEEHQARWNAEEAEHLRFEYDLQPDDVVIDLGAYRGEWAEAIYQRYLCRLVVVEPSDAIIGFPHGRIVKRAALDKDGAMEFGGAYYHTSQFAGPDFGFTTYPCFDINRLIREYDEIALLKINIEGGEFLVMPRILSEGLQTRIRNFQIQFHYIEDGGRWTKRECEDLYKAIYALLAQSHDLEWRYDFCWESWKRRDA
jgi:hypothetical protein